MPSSNRFIQSALHTVIHPSSNLSFQITNRSSIHLAFNRFSFPFIPPFIHPPTLYNHPSIPPKIKPFIPFIYPANRLYIQPSKLNFHYSNQPSIQPVIYQSFVDLSRHQFIDRSLQLFTPYPCSQASTQPPIHQVIIHLAIVWSIQSIYLAIRPFKQPSIHEAINLCSQSWIKTFSLPSCLFPSIQSTTQAAVYPFIQRCTHLSQPSIIRKSI